MNLKNPPKEFWDEYWTKLYNRLERSLAWLAISIGALILAGFGIIKAVEAFLADTHTDPIVKYGIAILILVFVILIFSLVREKIFSQKRDKFKEIQR